MILALDSSTLTLSLALLRRDGSLVDEQLIPPPARQSQVLPEALTALLARHSLALKDVTGFVVGLGPGSFTGLRIGLATIKGLAFTLKVPAVGVSSLAALALEGPAEATIFSCAMVKKGEVYLGRYRSDGHSLAPETSLTVSQLADALKADSSARMIGPALIETRAALEGQGVRAEQLLAGPLVPSAKALAKLATVPSSYDAQALFSLEPHYLRGSGAEENPKFPPLPGVPAVARLKED
ncbi:MAG: tRNA (adenosine(37)-N6)-threonylcarbamoyltransferase complex dimerization subunit type 1 TsaB [Archangium sp.]